MTVATRAPSLRDRGSITLPIVILTPALLVVAGLVVDGGYVLSARQRAFNEAEQAARAGAGAIDVDALRQGDLRLVEPRARALAQQYVAATEDTVGPVTVTPTTVTVTVVAQRRSVLLSLVGIDLFTVQGTATAEIERGIITGGDA